MSSDIKVKIVGLDALQVKLKGKATMDDVKNVVYKNGIRLTRTMKRQTKIAYKGGYSGHIVSTGTTGRSIKPPKISPDGLTATVGPTTDYSPYVEYGTRKMPPEPIAQPSLAVVGPKFIRDLQRITGE